MPDKMKKKYILALGIFEIIFCLATISHFIGLENFSYLKLIIILLPSLACIWIALSNQPLEKQAFGKILSYAITILYMEIYGGLVKDLAFGFLLRTVFFAIYFLSLIVIPLKGDVLGNRKKS